MRKISVVLCIAVLFALCGCSTGVKSTHGGKVVAITDSTLLYGSTDTLRLGGMVQGEVVQKSFDLVNDTAGTIVLLGCQTTCGCTQLIYDCKVLKSHESCNMICRYDSAGEYGWSMTILSLQMSGTDKTLDIFVESEVK